MKCPKCDVTTERISPACFWCPGCGWMGGEGGGRAPAQAKRYALIATERDRLQAFKDWTHQYLDARGVPHHPPGLRGAEGCRIGDRLDWLMARRTALREALAAIIEADDRHELEQVLIERARAVLTFDVEAKP